MYNYSILEDIAEIARKFDPDKLFGQPTPNRLVEVTIRTNLTRGHNSVYIGVCDRNLVRDTSVSTASLVNLGQI